MSRAIPNLLLIAKDSTCEQMLSSGVFEVTCVGTVAAAVERINSGSQDIIVMELALPDGHGLTAFNQIHSAALQAPIVVVVEDSEAELAARTLSLGAQDYVLKTQMTEAILCTAVRKALDRHYCELSHNQEGFLLQALMNNIPDSVYFKDTRSRFLMISRAKAKRHHLEDPQEVIGKTDADFFTAPHAKQALADEQSILRTGKPMENIEESETWPDGSVTWVSTTKMPLRNPAGRVVGTFGISRDITIRKNAQLALAEKTEQLHKKNLQIEDELKMARELQLAMLPQDFPLISISPYGAEALKFYSYYMPSGAVSGDFFDIYQLSDTAVGVFICDVMGHDVRAALVTAMIHALAEDFSIKTMDPGEILAEINFALFKVFRQAGTTMFATGLYMVLDVATAQLTYASAAHPPPLRLKRPAGTVEVLGPDSGTKKGAALGLFRDSKYPTFRRPMSQEDLVVFYTDGIIEEEAVDGEIFTRERLAETLANLSSLEPKELLAKTLAAIHQFSGCTDFSDDVCLVGVEVKEVKAANP